AVAGGKLTEAERADLLGRITYTSELADLAGCALVVEAVTENLDLKAGVFAQLDKITAPETILATNTSSLSVTEIGVHTGRPERVIGMHFFNPAPVLRFVEVVRTVVTEPDVITDVESLLEKVGNTVLVVGDRAGFLANSLLFSYLNHAVLMYEQHYATREDLDAAMKYGCGYPMGPLALLDLIGLDIASEILDTMYKQSRDRLHAPAPLLKQMITAGMLGRKTGRGFYTYEEAGSPVVVPDALTPREKTADTGTRRIARVGVVGTGTMATGIVEVFARKGFDVVLRARTAEKAMHAVGKV
ncbi:3-hydroxyacyl-CoA dehydrogenase NAD-binding domain-containing protein, partial [Kibdelosporangium lantanae]